MCGNYRVTALAPRSTLLAQLLFTASAQCVHLHHFLLCHCSPHSLHNSYLLPVSFPLLLCLTPPVVPLLPQLLLLNPARTPSQHKLHNVFNKTTHLTSVATTASFNCNATCLCPVPPLAVPLCPLLTSSPTVPLTAAPLSLTNTTARGDPCTPLVGCFT